MTATKIIPKIRNFIPQAFVNRNANVVSLHRQFERRNLRAHEKKITGPRGRRNFDRNATLGKWMPELYTALTQDKVIKEAALRSGVSKGVMQACWDAAGEMIKAWATEGHSVALPGLGTMRFGLHLAPQVLGQAKRHSRAAWAHEQSDHQSTRLVVVSVSICKQNKSICFQVDSWSQNEDLNWAPNIDWHRENAYLCSP